MPLDYNTQIRLFVDKYSKIINALNKKIETLEEKLKVLEESVSELILDTESEI